MGDVYELGVWFGISSGEQRVIRISYNSHRVWVLQVCETLLGVRVALLFI